MPIAGQFGLDQDGGDDCGLFPPSEPANSQIMRPNGQLDDRPVGCFTANRQAVMGEADLQQLHALQGLANRVGEIRCWGDLLRLGAQPRGGIIADRAVSRTSHRRR